MSSFAKKVLVIVINTASLFVFAFAPATFSFRLKGHKFYSSELTVLQELSFYAEKGHYNRAYPGGALIGYLIILAFLIVIVAYIMALSNKRPEKLTDQVLQILPAVPLALIMLMQLVGAIPIKYGNYVQYVMRPGFSGYLVMALCIASLVIMLVIPVKESAQAGGTIVEIPNKNNVAETKFSLRDLFDVAQSNNKLGFVINSAQFYHVGTPEALAAAETKIKQNK